MERTDRIYIFIISLMLACGIGFFLWGTVLHKVEHSLEIQKTKKHETSIAIESVSTHESQIRLSKFPVLRVNASIRKKKANIQRDYTSESEINRLAIAPYEMSEVALPFLAVVDLSLILENATLDSGIEERIIDERVEQPTVDSLFPLRKSNPHISFPQKRAQHAIVIQLTNTTLESEHDRISGSSGHKKNKASTSKSKVDRGSYSTSL